MSADRKQINIPAGVESGPIRIVSLEGNIEFFLLSNPIDPFVFAETAQAHLNKVGDGKIIVAVPQEKEMDIRNLKRMKELQESLEYTEHARAVIFYSGGNPMLSYFGNMLAALTGAKFLLFANMKQLQTCYQKALYEAEAKLPAELISSLPGFLIDEA